MESNHGGPVFLSADEEGNLPDTDAMISALSSNVQLLTSELRKKASEDVDVEHAARLDSMIQESISLSKTMGTLSHQLACQKIDALLLEQSEMPSCSTDVTTDHRESSNKGVTAANDELAKDHEAVTSIPVDLQNAPRITAEIESRELESLSDKDRTDIYVDIFGRKPPRENMLQDCMDAFDKELGKIPADSKSALLRAQREFPLLCSSSSHTMLFLQAESFNPKEAAQRMVRYWEKRVEFYGDLAFTAPSFSRPTKGDYLSLYNRSINTSLDPDVDEETKEIAAQFVRGWEDAKITNMDNELEKIPPHEKTSFVKAQKTAPNHVTPREKLLFLQSVDFDEACAARKMVNYWNAKFDLFGDDCAFGPMEILLKDHSDELSMGLIRLLPGTDTSGRALLCLTPSKLSTSDYTTEGLLKVTWCVCHAALERKNIQHKGVVLLTVMTSSSLDNYNVGLMSKMGKVLHCIPFKERAVHYINPPGSWWMHRVYPIIKFVIGEELRKRHVLHTGSTEQALRTLGDCGISSHQIPCEIGGNLASTTVAGET